MSDTKLFVNNTEELTIEKETFQIKPFTIRQRTKLLGFISEFAKAVQSDPEKNDINDVSSISESIVLMFGNKLIDIYVIVLNKDKDWIETNVTINDEINIIHIIWRVNNLSFLFGKIKNGMGKISK